MDATRYLVAAALAASATAVPFAVGTSFFEGVPGPDGLRALPPPGLTSEGPTIGMALSAPAPGEPAPGPAYGTYAWPVRGPMLRPYDPPETPYGSGHRGIDIGAVQGTPLVAAQDGVVAFAGPIGGDLFVSIDHPDGVRTTYSWLGEVSVRRGDSVRRGEHIGRTGPGHPGSGRPHLHLGARIGTMYIDPMLLLERGSVVGLVHLAPLQQEPHAARSESPA
jgi:murein DD-endopeptidase MepM/ murein hydrolase activator NlpD